MPTDWNSVGSAGGYVPQSFQLPGLDMSAFNTPAPVYSGGSGYSASGLANMGNNLTGVPAVTGLGGGGGSLGGSGIGTMGYLNAGLSGLQTLGSLWMGLKQLKLANKQFNFTKEITNTNLANSMKTYNTALADRARSRGFTEGQSQGQIDSYTSSNSLNRPLPH